MNLAGTATIDATGNGTVTISSTVSGAGGITFNSNGGGSLILNGNNTFAGGIFQTGSGSTVSTITLNGATAGGTGTLSTPNTAEGEVTTLNLRSDSSAIFTLSGVVFNQTEDYNNGPTSSTTINVGPITSGVTGQTLTLNSVTGPADQSPTASTFVLNSTAGSGYTLDITTFTPSRTITPSSARIRLSELAL